MCSDTAPARAPALSAPPQGAPGRLCACTVVVAATATPHYGRRAPAHNYQCKSHVVRSGMRSGGAGDDPHTRPFMTTADAVANKARIQRGDKANEVDEALNGGAPAFHTAMAKQGAMHGIAVGGCCELSTSAHHLVAKIGEEQGYRLAESSGMDIEDAITIATRLLKGRIAKQVWRDYHKHAFARRCYADPSDMGLKALQLSEMRREQDQTEREQLQLQHTLLTRLHHGWRRGIG